MKRWILAVVLFAGCAGNVCERQLELEEDECFPELEQMTDVEKDECVDDRKAYAKCAMSNQSDYCDYFLWQNRAAARREGYTVSDSPPIGSSFIACLDEEGLREQ